MSQTKQQQQRHAIQRFWERHGLKVTTHDLEQMREQIQSGGAEFLRKQTLRVSAYRVQVQGTEVEVLYDKHTHTVMTVVSREGAHVD